MSFERDKSGEEPNISDHDNGHDKQVQENRTIWARQTDNFVLTQEQKKVQGSEQRNEPLFSKVLGKTLLLAQNGAVKYHDTELGERPGVRLEDKFKGTSVGSQKQSSISKDHKDAQQENKFKNMNLDIFMVDEDECSLLLETNKNLYGYLKETETVIDGDRFKDIKEDLVGRLYSAGEVDYEDVQKFQRIVKRLSPYLKKDFKDKTLLLGVLDFIVSSDFVEQYYNYEGDGGIIGLYIQNKIYPLQTELQDFWKEFKLILKQNLHKDHYDLYTNSVKIEYIQGTLELGKVGRRILYPSISNSDLMEDFVHTFEEEVISVFVEYAKRRFGNNVFKYIEFEYGYSPEIRGREHSHLLSKANNNRKLGSYNKLKHKLIVHDGNRDICDLLSQRLVSQTSPPNAYSVRHCLIVGPRGSGRSTTVKYYLQQLQSKFPRTKIQEYAVDYLVGRVGVIMQDADRKLLDDLKDEVLSHDVVYINDFDKMTDGAKFWLKSVLSGMKKGNHTKFIFESEKSYAVLDAELEQAIQKDYSPDPNKRKRNIFYSRQLSKTIYEAYEASAIVPTKKARAHIIQETLEFQFKGRVPMKLAQYLAGSTVDIVTINKVISTIKHQIKDIFEKDNRDQTIKQQIEKIMAQQISSIPLGVATVYWWFKDFCGEYNVDKNEESRGQMFAAFAYEMTRKDAPLFNQYPQNREPKHIGYMVDLPKKYHTAKQMKTWLRDYSQYLEDRRRFMQNRMHMYISESLYKTGDIDFYGSEQIITKDPIF